MNLTKTSNSALAKHCFVDASYISRLRRGKRNVVKDADYLEKMAEYFSTQIDKKYQKKILIDIFHIKQLEFSNNKLLCEKIYIWLTESTSDENFTIDNFFNSMSKINFTQNNKTIDSRKFNQLSNLDNISLYFGMEGKRQAVINFLNEIIHSKTTNELLLYSDEPMNWLTDDLSFLKLWSDLLKKVILKGNTIKIIHTVSRNLDEMLQALSKWMPLYMTGAITPYYYPKKRDGIANRTIFVCPNKIGLTATSTGQMNDATLNILLKDPKAVHSLTTEFNNYLGLCNPLMHIFTEKNQSDFLNILNDFEKEKTDGIYLSHQLSLLTLPKKLAISIIQNSNINNKEKFINFYSKRHTQFVDILEQNEFYEIINLPKLSDFNNGTINLGFSGIYELNDYYYSVHHYISHLQNLIKLINTYENYRVIINTKNTLNEFKIYAKEDLGVIVLKTSKPEIIFAINESNMTAAFWDYCQEFLTRGITDQKKVIEELTRLITQIKGMI